MNEYCARSSFAASRDARARLAYALDYASGEEALRAARVLQPAIGVFKIGLELFIKEGPRIVAEIAKLDRDIFLDLKLCDIPETVRRAVASASSFGVRYLTIHASGGRAMLETAANEATKGTNPLQLLAVTLLTSLGESDLTALGIHDNVPTHVERMAHLAWTSNVTGFVASAVEAQILRETFGVPACIVTPGIRPAGADAGDQKRMATPKSAIEAGASLLVVGRPIRDAENPLVAAENIVTEIAQAMAP